MSNMTAMKRLSLATGLYRTARFLDRHLLSREKLHALRRDTAFFSRMVEAGSLCFDVGANIGEKSEALLRAGATVVAIEPQPDCVLELTARCGHYPRFNACQVALGSQEGETQMYVHSTRTSSSLDPRWAGEIEDSIRVPVTTLDCAIDEFGVPSFCKIDVEGWEFEVLKGLSRAIPLISFEYRLIEGGLEKVFACLDLLGRLGGLSINITPAEDLEFGLSEWCSPEEFRNRFPSEFGREDRFFYGDIFVQTR